jgi:hypothetical protein
MRWLHWREDTDRYCCHGRLISRRCAESSTAWRLLTLFGAIFTALGISDEVEMFGLKGNKKKKSKKLDEDWVVSNCKNVLSQCLIIKPFFHSQY